MSLFGDEYPDGQHLPLSDAYLLRIHIPTHVANDLDVDHGTKNHQRLHALESQDHL